MAIPTNLTDETLLDYVEHELDLARRAHELKLVYNRPVEGLPDNMREVILDYLGLMDRQRRWNASNALLNHIRDNSPLLNHIHERTTDG